MNTRLYSRSAYSQRPIEKRLIANSEVIKLGGLVTDVGVGMDAWDATGDKIAGFAVMFFDRFGYPVSHRHATLGAATVNSAGTITVAADNQTVDQVQVGYFPLRDGDEVVMTLDAVKGTTTGSNKAGYNLTALTTDSSLLDESTAAVAETNCHFKIKYPTRVNLSTTEVVVTPLPSALQISA